MKLVTYEVSSRFGPQRRIGVLIDGQQDGRIMDVRAAYEAYLSAETDEPTPAKLAALRTPPDMIGWIEGRHKSREAAEQALAYVKAKLAESSDVKGPGGEQLVLARSEVRLLSPLPRPRSFRDFSIFEEHGSRRDGDDPAVRRHKPPNWYRWPPYYKGSADSITGPEDPIPYVYYTKKLDLEPEIGIIVGKQGRNLSFDEAKEAIAGYTIVIDCSDRGAAQRDTLGPAKSKDWCTVVGPCLVTPDEIDEGNLGVKVIVDGEIWFEGRSNAPRSFLAHHLVAYASDNETIYPGDLLGTGTVGTGCSLDIRKWVRVGQTVRFEFEGLGYLEHRIVPGEQVVDYVGSGMDGLLKAPPPAAG